MVLVLFCFLDLLKSVFFEFFGELAFIAGKKIAVSFWMLVLLNVFDLINA